LEAGLEVEYARDSTGFRWTGCDEGDEVEGEATAELLDDGTIEIEFAYHNGDEAVLKAKRNPSSTACHGGGANAVLAAAGRWACPARHPLACLRHGDASRLPRTPLWRSSAMPERQTPDPTSLAASYKRKREPPPLFVGDLSAYEVLREAGAIDQDPFTAAKPRLHRSTQV
jgi:hypothetical protein